jgi:hypothetical protein
MREKFLLTRGESARERLKSLRSAETDWDLGPDIGFLRFLGAACQRKIFKKSGTQECTKIKKKNIYI